MKTKSVYLSVRVDYSYDETKKSVYDTDYIASNLVVRPNYTSIVDSVQLDYVEVCGMREE